MIFHLKKIATSPSLYRLASLRKTSINHPTRDSGGLSNLSEGLPLLWACWEKKSADFFFMSLLLPLMSVCSTAGLTMTDPHQYSKSGKIKTNPLGSSPKSWKVKGVFHYSLSIPRENQQIGLFLPISSFAGLGKGLV